MRFAPMLLCAAAVWGASLLDRSAGPLAGGDGLATQSGLHDGAEGNTEFVLAELRHKIHTFKQGVRAETARWVKLRQQIAGLENSILGGGSGEPAGGPSAVVVAGGAVAGAVPRPYTKPAVPPGPPPAARAAPLPSLKPDRVIEPEAARIATTAPARANGHQTTAIAGNPSAPAPATVSVPRAPTRAPHGSAGPGAAAGHAPPPPAGEGRLELTAAQMDAITAGLAAVEINALAAAHGPNTLTSTKTGTNALGHELLEFAYGTGEALAIGDQSAVDLSASYYADGDFVVGGQYRIVIDGPRHAEGYAAAVVVSIDADHPDFDAVRGRYEGLASRIERGYDAYAGRLERLGECGSKCERGGEHLASGIGRSQAGMVQFIQAGYASLLGYAIRDLRRLEATSAR